MSTLEEIIAEIKNVDTIEKNTHKKREVSELPNILWENEHIEKISSGRYEGGFGIAVATNQRLLFIDKGMTGSLKVEDFSYDKINSIQFKTGMVMGEVEIYSSGNKAKIDNILKQSVRDFAEHIKSKITSKESQSIKTANQDDDIISKLERLAKLKEQGILNEEEFLEQKKRIISQ